MGRGVISGGAGLAIKEGDGGAPIVGHLAGDLGQRVDIGKGFGAADDVVEIAIFALGLAATVVQPAVEGAGRDADKVGGDLDLVTGAEELGELVAECGGELGTSGVGHGSVSLSC